VILPRFRQQPRTADDVKDHEEAITKAAATSLHPTEIVNTHLSDAEGQDCD